MKQHVLHLFKAPILALGVLSVCEVQSVESLRVVSKDGQDNDSGRSISFEKRGRASSPSVPVGSNSVFIAWRRDIYHGVFYW